MNWKAAFKGQYVSAVEFEGREPTWTFAAWRIEQIESVSLKGEDAEGKVKDRLVLYVEEQPRGWVMNRTNAICLEALFGSDETDDWMGKRVTLVAEKVRVGPKMDWGIRVKGSPDLTKPMVVEIKLPRKKSTPRTLVPTGEAMPLPEFRGQLGAALKAGWNEEQIKTLLGGPANDVPPGDRAGVVAQLKAGPAPTNEFQE